MTNLWTRLGRLDTLCALNSKRRFRFHCIMIGLLFNREMRTGTRTHSMCVPGVAIPLPVGADLPTIPTAICQRLEHLGPRSVSSNTPDRSLGDTSNTHTPHVAGPHVAAGPASNRFRVSSNTHTPHVAGPHVAAGSASNRFRVSS